MTDTPIVRADGVKAAPFAVVTAQEVPSTRNPYVAVDVRTHGYSLHDLVGRVSFTDMLFLSLVGEMPTRAQRRLLDDLLVVLASPGPRHPAVRAAMYASVSKTVVGNVLPISLLVLSGSHLGARECFEAMKFLVRIVAKRPTEVAAETVKNGADEKPAPGFGSRFGGRDELSCRFLRRFARRKAAGAYVRWADRYASALEPYGMGALPTGMAAAVMLDLGFTSAQGSSVFQMAHAPHIVAMAAEMGAKGPKGMPFLPDDHYHITSRRGE